MDDAGAELLSEVRAAQAELGSGVVETALAMVEPLLDRTAAAVRAPSFLARARPDRQAVVDAFCYARVTAILALESIGASQAVPRIRALAAEARDVAGRGTPGWKVQTAAAEMLARCGDGPGAAAAVEAAGGIAPPGEAYVPQLRASIRAMFPAAFEDG